MLLCLLPMALALLAPTVGARLPQHVVPPEDQLLRSCDAEQRMPAALRNATPSLVTVLPDASTVFTDCGTAECCRVQPSVLDPSMSYSCCVRPPEAWRPPGWVGAISKRAVRAVGGCRHAVWCLPAYANASPFRLPNGSHADWLSLATFSNVRLAAHDGDEAGALVAVSSGGVKPRADHVGCPGNQTVHGLGSNGTQWQHTTVGTRDFSRASLQWGRVVPLHVEYGSSSDAAVAPPCHLSEAGVAKCAAGTANACAAARTDIAADAQAAKRAANACAAGCATATTDASAAAVTIAAERAADACAAERATDAADASTAAQATASITSANRSAAISADDVAIVWAAERTADVCAAKRALAATPDAPRSEERRE